MLGTCTEWPLAAAAAADVEAAAAACVEGILLEVEAATAAEVPAPPAAVLKAKSGMGSVLIVFDVVRSLSSTAIIVAAEAVGAAWAAVAVAPPFALATCKVRAAWLMLVGATEEEAPAAAANCCCSKMWLGIGERFCFVNACCSGCCCCVAFKRYIVQARDSFYKQLNVSDNMTTPSCCPYAWYSHNSLEKKRKCLYFKSRKIL